MEHMPLTDADRAVVQQAIAAATNLYVPGLQEVGAAVRTANGQLFSGIHFETATGFASICGEIAALCCMVAAGHRDLEVIAAVWPAADGALHLLPPCGRCREVIADFNPQAWVIITQSPDHWDRTAIEHSIKVPISALLPRKSHILKP